jgi:hypothetical protein
LRPPPPPPPPRPPPPASSSSGTPRMCSSDVHTVGSSGGLSSGGFGLCWCGGPRCAMLSCPAPSFPSERNRWSGVSSDIAPVAVSRPTPRGFAHSSHSTSNKLNPSGQRPGRGEHSWHRRPSNRSRDHAPTRDRVIVRSDARDFQKATHEPWPRDIKKHPCSAHHTLAPTDVQSVMWLCQERDVVA